jgi:hypothetical protein
MLARVLRLALRALAPTFAALLVALAACDSGSVPGFAGMACTSSSDCSSGLQCLDYKAPGEGGCVSYGQTCVQPCQTSADCASAGTGYACVATCGTAAICQPAPALDAGGQ